MKSALVSGHGLIASSLVTKLVSQGIAVTVLSRQVPFNPVSGASFIQCDLRDISSLRSSLPKGFRADSVFHTAAATSQKATDFSGNLQMTKNLLIACQAWGTEKFIFTSGTSLYQQRGSTHALEEVDELESNLGGYLETKKLEEEEILRASFPSVIARVSAPIGNEMPSDRLIPTLVRNALRGYPTDLGGSGNRLQDYVHVEDIAEGLFMLTTPEDSGIFNLASGVSITNLELADFVYRTIGADENQIRQTLPTASQPGWAISIGKLRRLTGYSPRIKTYEFIRDLCERGDQLVKR